MYSFFDTHTHLDYLQQATGEPLAQLMQNAQTRGVQKMLIVAVLQRDFKTIEKMTALYINKIYSLLSNIAICLVAAIQAPT